MPEMWKLQNQNTTHFLMRAFMSVSQLVLCRVCSGRASIAPRFGSCTTNTSKNTAKRPRAGVTWQTEKQMHGGVITSVNVASERNWKFAYETRCARRLTLRAQCQSFALLSTADPTIYPRPLKFVGERKRERKINECQHMVKSEKMWKNVWMFEPLLGWQFFLGWSASTI